MTKEGKLKERLSIILTDDNYINRVLDEAKKDILRKIKEYEYEDIPDDIMKEKIIEWFGDEDESDR